MTLCDFAAMLVMNSPRARAKMQGKGISGEVSFFDTGKNVLVVADISGLPWHEKKCECDVFGFHIHSGGDCGGTAEAPFADTKGHYDPQGCPHPCHAGDMPPLLGNSCRAWLAFLTDRIKVEEIIGKTVVIHSAPDDFTTQPSGNYGSKIACGAIERLA